MLRAALSLLTTSLISLQAFAFNVQVPEQGLGPTAIAQSKLTATVVLNAFAKKGFALTPQQMSKVSNAAGAGEVYQRSANSYASLDTVSTLHRVLICVKAKAGGFLFKVEGGVCSDLLGTLYLLTGSGLGLSSGVAASVVAMVYVGPFDIPLTHDYAGVASGVNASNQAKIALKMTKLVKGMPKLMGPDFGVFTDYPHGGYLIMLGIQIGPMVDLAAEKLTLSYL